MVNTLSKLATISVKRLQKFIQLETSSGIILFLMAIAALVISNSPWQADYHWLFNEYLIFNQTANFWINDGLMVFFFTLIGLEIKREIRVGELDTKQKRILPSLAALGGMVVPALIFIAFNWQDPIAINGWAIPAATDIAFALGILLLLGSRVPLGLKIFLMALAIIDDLGAIIIITLFYTTQLSLNYLILAGLCCGLLWLSNKKNITHLAWYALLGIALWFCILNSGIHPTIAGVIVAFAIPLHAKGFSPLRTLEYYLHPWVAFAIMPLFAFANAGLNFTHLHLADFANSLPLGIICGLLLGKPLGIISVSALAIKLNYGQLPEGVNWQDFYGMAFICGVGFTMSLFIGNLAYENLVTLYNDYVRLGVLCGSLIAGLLGYSMLRLNNRKVA